MNLSTNRAEINSIYIIHNGKWLLFFSSLFPLFSFYILFTIPFFFNNKKEGKKCMHVLSTLLSRVESNGLLRKEIPFF